MDDSLEYPPFASPLRFEENDSFFKLNECSVLKSEYLLRSQITHKIEYKLDSNLYDFTHSQRGLAIIINNRDFYEHLELSARSGTDQDAKLLQSCFSQLGFKVYIHENLTVKDTMYLSQSTGKYNFANSDCLIFVIMTHGEDGLLWGVDATFKLEDITYYFRGDMCPTLVGKPKLFFIQACRGTKLDHGITFEYTDADEDEVDAKVIRKIPVESDFLLAYSVVTGYYSWRNCQDGSWFIQSLCRALKQFAGSLDLLRILTRVNSMVCEYESNTNDIHWDKKKQCPSIVSMLTKDLYFFHPSFKSFVAGDGKNAQISSLSQTFSSLLSHSDSSSDKITAQEKLSNGDGE